MKKLINECTDFELDWLAGSAQGFPVEIVDGRCIIDRIFRYSPSTDWLHAGPLIDKARIALSPHFAPIEVEGWNGATERGEWKASVGEWKACGPTAEMAVTRAYVMTWYGEEASVPG